MSLRTSLSRLAGNPNRILRDGIRILSSAPIRKHPQSLTEQPFDSLLLRQSALFRRSRKRFIEGGGRFYATLVSSPRTLSSSLLLTSEIEYTPIERELIWAATDPKESKDRNFTRLLQTRILCTSLFHEQNHRILQRFLPRPSHTPSQLTRYLNTSESLVIALDMALGDELRYALSRILYLAGVTYDPGTDILDERISRRSYLNYLHASMYATYLKLQFFDPRDIRKVVHSLYPVEPQLTERAIRRALKLDDKFVQITNPQWQKDQMPNVIRLLPTLKRSALVFPKDPLDNHVHYLWAERWFQSFFASR